MLQSSARPPSPSPTRYTADREWPPREDRLHHALDPGLQVLLVGREIDFGYALGGGKPPLILGRITTHSSDVVERPRLATHNPLADGEIEIRRIRVLGLERCFVETGRQDID